MYNVLRLCHEDSQVSFICAFDALQDAINYVQSHQQNMKCMPDVEKYGRYFVVPKNELTLFLK